MQTQSSGASDQLTNLNVYLQNRCSAAFAAVDADTNAQAAMTNVSNFIVR